MDASMGGSLDTAGNFGKKVAIFVEPSPFSHISGMKNRFECLIKGLRDAGDEVLVVTPDPNPPKEYFGAKVPPPPPPPPPLLPTSTCTAACLPSQPLSGMQPTTLSRRCV